MEWTFPIVSAPKEDGSLWSRVNCGMMNAVTVPDCHPIQRIDKCIDLSGDELIISTLHTNSSYWLREVNDKDRDKTALTLHPYLHWFERKPFGLCIEPYTFQQSTDVILLLVKFQFALVYIWKILLYLQTVQTNKHFAFLRRTLAPSKCFRHVQCWEVQLFLWKHWLSWTCETEKQIEIRLTVPLMAFATCNPCGT